MNAYLRKLLHQRQRRKFLAAHRARRHPEHPTCNICKGLNP